MHIAQNYGDRKKVHFPSIWSRFIAVLKCEVAEVVANFQSENIDKIIEKLTDIIDTSIQTKSRQGYFAALYRKVTIRIKEGIAENFFDNGERMERFDVIFANRYLAAYEAYQNHDKPSQSWAIRISSG